MGLDIIDIVLGKKKAQGEAATIMASAREALSEATSAAEQATAATEAAQTASEAATAAAETATMSAEELTQLREDVTSAATEVVEDKIREIADTEYIPQVDTSFRSVNERIDEISSTVDNINKTTAAEKTAIENATTTAETATRAANEVKETANKAVIDWRTSVTTPTSKAYKDYTAQVKKANGDVDAWVASRNYTATGQNEDGAMTQKAITDALSNQKTELVTKINNITINGGGGNVSGNVGDAEPGTIVVVGDDGEIEAGDTTQIEIIKTQIAVGTYRAKDAVGIEIDYENKLVNRIQESSNYTAGADFDKYQMFGGRRRCTVADDGTINHFFGETGYVEDGSDGQVMVYQPKFYYMRFPIKTATSVSGTKIQKEILLLSTVKQAGFSIMPIFKDTESNILDYVLGPAYAGSAYDVSLEQYLKNDEQTVDFNIDLLCSIAGVKPISGASQELNAETAQALARHRGVGWQLTDMAFEAMTQMLMIVEFGSLNIQTAFNKGIVELNNYNNINSSAITGATSSLGATSGMAASTTLTHDSTTETYSVEGKSSISYRGFENPYGDLWRFIGNAYAEGSRNNHGGNLYINDYKLEFDLPNSSSWIAGFGYDENCDWVFIPVETSSTTANSALPVGDYIYVIPNLNTKNCCVIGGKTSSTQYAGPFYYGMDYAYNYSAYSYGACIMYKPNKNTAVYNNNIDKWKKEVGGE